MLNRQEIEKLVREKSLIKDCIDLDTQLTPNGFDLTVAAIYVFDSVGALDFSNKERQVPQTPVIEPKKKKSDDKFAWWYLKKGAYKVITNETVCIPKDLVAIAFSRTSLLRMGASTQHGVWDAGFCGRSEFLLVVDNPKGIMIKQNARIAQLVFLHINETAHGYQGIYQNK